MSRGGRLRRVEPTTTSADGIWTLNEIADYISENKWPRGPAAPTSLSASAGNAQLSLSWTAPSATHGNITNYLVEYTPSGGSAAYVLTGSTSTSYTLTGLTNGTAYTVRLAAVNFTAGDYSGTQTATPNVILVPGAVLNLRETARGDYCAGQLFVSFAWNAPATGGTPDLYRILGGGGFSGMNETTTQTSITIYRSAQGFNSITVRAENSAGQGPVVELGLTGGTCD